MTRLISCSEYARRRGISVQRVRQLARSGRIAGAQRVGERWVIPPSAAVVRHPPGRPSAANRSTAIDAILARRIEQRRRLLQAVAARVHARLRAAGVACVPIGSFAAGAVRFDSDLDLLVLRHPGKSWAQVDRLAARAAADSGVEVDLVFGETLRPADKARMFASCAT